MIYLYSFLFSGILCLIGEIIYDNTKFSPGHITSLFVVIGSFLSIFGIYQFFIDTCGGGAIVAITNFSHLLVQGGLEGINKNGFLGIFTSLFCKASGTLSFTIFSSCVASLLSLYRK